MKKVIIIFTMILIASTNSYGQSYNIDDLSNYPGTITEQQKEDRLGREVLMLLKNKLPFVHDPEVLSYLNSLSHKLDKHFVYNNLPLKIYLINNPAINAFTLPGGHIVIHTGLIANSDNEDQLAAVMAHEIAHATQFHIKKTMDYGKQMQLSSIAATIAAAILTVYNPILGQGALAASLAAPQQAMINYVRHNEKEADRIGINALYHAGFDPFAMPEFLNKLSSKESTNGEHRLEYLRTHPITESRVSDTINRAQQYPYKQYPQSKSFYFVKAKIMYLSSNDDKDEIANLKRQLKYDLCEKDFAVKYQLALHYLDIEHNKALPYINDLQQEFPQNIYIKQLHINYLEKNQEHKKAFDEISKLHEYLPHSYAVNLRYGELALEAKQPQKAINILDQYVMNNNAPAAIYNILAKAHYELGDKITYQENYATYLALDGKIHLAIQQLKLLLDNKELEMSKYQRNKITALLNKFKKIKKDA